MSLINISVTKDELVALWNLRHRDPMPLVSYDSSPISSYLPTKIGKNAPLRMPTTNQGNFHYQILGENRSAKNAVEAFVDILKILATCETDFAEELSRLSPASSRNHVARSRSEVYPERPDLGKNACEFAKGWYVGINISNLEKRKILRLACDVLDLKFGNDIIF